MRWRAECGAKDPLLKGKAGELQGDNDTMAQTRQRWCGWDSSYLGEWLIKFVLCFLINIEKSLKNRGIRKASIHASKFFISVAEMQPCTWAWRHNQSLTSIHSGSRAISRWSPPLWFSHVWSALSGVMLPQCPSASVSGFLSCQTLHSLPGWGSSPTQPPCQPSGGPGSFLLTGSRPHAQKPSFESSSGSYIFLSFVKNAFHFNSSILCVWSPFPVNDLTVDVSLNWRQNNKALDFPILHPMPVSSLLKYHLMHKQLFSGSFLASQRKYNGKKKKLLSTPAGITACFQK